MNRHRFGAIRLSGFLATLAFCMCIALPSALAQEDMKEIKADAFAPHSRPAALFVHDTHNEKAGIPEDACETCHHGKDANGKQDKTDNSAGVPCADCHTVAVKESTPLMRAYHQQCINCHTSRSAGPTHCAGCHKKT